MRKILFLFGAGLLFSNSGHAQQSTLDIAGMHQLINQSKDEYSLQTSAKNQQGANTATERSNMILLSKLKSTYRRLQQRYTALGTAINVADIGVYATPMVERIISGQAQIVRLTQKDPALIALGYRTEIEFARKAQSLLGYMAGLSLSLGDVNQMRPSDRKLLFDFVIAELSRIQELSGNLVSLLQNRSLWTGLRAFIPFRGFVSQDRSIAEHIIMNAKYLKP